MNKLLAGVGRLAIRDYIDLIDLDARHLRLGALAWAGCLYLDASGQPVTPDPQAPGFPRLLRHFGTLRGSWPRLAPP